jgi:hypothetical protein
MKPKNSLSYQQETVTILYPETDRNALHTAVPNLLTQINFNNIFIYAYISEMIFFFKFPN